MNISKNSTNENAMYSVESFGVETLIREYSVEHGQYCAVYFPGRHGGIPRYEKEIFEAANQVGVNIYALSYPGYEGASGKPTFENVLLITEKAINYIDKNTACDISKSIFIARSLGVAIALENALLFKPKGLLLDSVALSLSDVINSSIKNNILLWPLRIIPLASVLQYDFDLMKSLHSLESTPVVIFQGELDYVSKSKLVEQAVGGLSHMEFMEVDGATHTNTQVQAGKIYFEKMLQLLE